MRCTGYEMARHKGTQASQLYEKSMHTLCTISEQPLLAEASTILDQSLSHTNYNCMCCTHTYMCWSPLGYITVWHTYNANLMILMCLTSEPQTLSKEV